MKVLKILLYILVPVVCISIVGAYFGHWQFLEGIKRDMDESDNYQWAIVARVFYSPVGLVVGLALDLFIWLFTNEAKKEKVL